jgi:hypothetical protein
MVNFDMIPCVFEFARLINEKEEDVSLTYEEFLYYYERFESLPGEVRRDIAERVVSRMSSSQSQ